MEIRTWQVFFSLCIITALLLSGCVGIKTPSVSRSAPPGIFVDYQRSGGIAGINERVVIFDNGITMISNGKTNTELTLNQTELERIGALFTTAKYSDLEINYTSGRGGADLLHYSVNYHGKTVHTEDTAIPLALQPILDEMNQILSRGLMSDQTGSTLPKIGS
jgi:hypothetical protein